MCSGRDWVHCGFRGGRGGVCAAVCGGGRCACGGVQVLMPIVLAMLGADAVVWGLGQRAR